MKRLLSIPNRLNKGETGFTLIELMVVLTILAIIVGLVVPNVFGIAKGAECTMIVGQHEKMREAVFMYYIDTNQWPTEWSGNTNTDDPEEHELWNDDCSGWDGPYLDRPIMQKNSWGEDWGVVENHTLSEMGVFVCLVYEGVPDELAQCVDDKMDDRAASSGAVQWDNGSSGNRTLYIGITQQGNTTPPAGPDEEDNQPPVAYAGEDVSVDEGSSIELDGTQSTDPDEDPLDYSWVITTDPTGDASLTNSDTPTPLFSAPSVDTDTDVTVELTVDDGHQRTNTDTVTITIEARVSTLNITTTELPDGTEGEAFSATLEASGGTTPYIWSMSGNLPAGLTLDSDTGHISGTPSTAGTHGFSAEVEDSGSPKQTDSQSLSISIMASNQSPHASLTYSPSSPTTADTINFTDQSSDTDGEVASWLWEFGDGSTSSQQNPSHQYSGNGTYTVTLTVTDDDGATDGVSEDIIVAVADPGSPGETAYDDVNDNLQYDDGEAIYSESELYDFDDDNTNLVIPMDVGGGSISNYKISIKANKITSYVDIASTGDEVKLETSSGPITATGVNIQSGNNVKVESASQAALDKTNITAREKVSVLADEISAANAIITTDNDEVKLETSSGPVSAPGATIQSGNNVEVDSASQAVLDHTTITAREKVTVSADNISAMNAAITTENDEVRLEASGGPVDSTEANIESGNNVEVDSASQAVLDHTTITAREKVTASADNISAMNAEITTDNDKVRLNARWNGAITITGADIESGNNIEILNGTSTGLDNSTITAREKVVVVAGDVSATNAEITTDNDKVRLEASGGSVDSTGANIQSGNNVEVESASQVALDNTTIIASEKMTVLANSISATNAEITTNNDKVRLNAQSNGGIIITGASIESGHNIEILNGTSTGLDDTTITAREKVMLVAGEVSAINAEITTHKDKVRLEASGGPISASGVQIDSSNNIELDARQDIYIGDSDSKQSKILAVEDATAELNDNSNTLHCNGVNIEDEDNTLMYSPSGVTVVGTSEHGSVESH
ncbi:MAG: PKD domain-containing protein [Dehalococcoidia bacterium]